jgi:hypothetical protein
MKNPVLLKVSILMSIAALMAQADILFDTTDQLVSADPTQLGRLSRNGTPQDWAGSEAFPGVINTGVTYHYMTYLVNVGATPFIQIDVDSISASTFVSAYDVSYAPDSAGAPNHGFDTNWLGDAGFSGNLFGTDPIFFNVIAPVNSNLIVVVNETAANGGGLLQPYHLTVEGYLDSSFTSTPEPSSLLLVLAALSIMYAARTRRGSRQSR